MKKILPAILLLTLSLPALASEVELSCHMKDKSGGNEISDTYRWDEDKQTVNGQSVNAKCRNSGKSCIEYFLNDTKAGYISYSREGRVISSIQISRLDGSIVKANGNHESIAAGVCQPVPRSF